MNKKEFIKQILKNKDITKDIFKLSLKLEDFPIARQILKKISDRREVQVILKSNNIIEIKTAQANIIGEHLNFIQDSFLKSKSINFINELVDEKLLYFSESNTAAINNYYSPSEYSKTLKINFLEEDAFKNSSVEGISKSNTQTFFPKFNTPDNEDPLIEDISVNEFLNNLRYNYQSQDSPQIENNEENEEESWYWYDSLFSWIFCSLGVGSLMAVIVFLISGGQYEARKKNALIVGLTSGLLSAIFVYGEGKSLEKEEEFKQSSLI